MISCFMDMAAWRFIFTWSLSRCKNEQHQYLGLCCSTVTMPSETAKRLNVEASLLLEFEALRNSQFLQFLVLNYYSTTSKPHLPCPAQNYCLPSSLFTLPVTRLPIQWTHWGEVTCCRQGSESVQLFCRERVYHFSIPVAKSLTHF